MVPTDYQLDHVVARLIERLDGSRPTFSGQPDKAMASFERTTREHVEAAIEEFAEVSLVDDPEPQAAFLRREVMETFLPRYHRLALEMGEKERSGFGFGAAYEPVGRLGMVVVSLLVLWFVLLKLIYLPVVWPLVLLDLSFATWPSIAAGLTNRRYRSQLTEIVDDMSRIQEQHSAYLPKSAFADAAESRIPTPRKRESE